MSATPPPDPRQWDEALRWLARADEDSRAADALLDAGAPIIGAAAFHCQQAAEKMAKAVLIAHGRPPPRVHDITALAASVAELDPETGALIAALGGITRWYTAARYPDAGADTEPTVDDVRDVLTRLQDLRERIAGLAGPQSP